ncbi:MAG: hypothetical protein C6I00_04790 [Nitratiruptor sp.]|nr:hypothetical protein [Nitratiruptor sp.]NPA84226.1 hypothetical protein [Campylobacterota bacterium]
MDWVEKLEEIAQDRIHGATYLTERLVEVAIEAKGRREFLELAQNIQPYMASLYNFVQDLSQGVKEGQEWIPFCRHWWEEFRRAHREVVAQGAKIIEGKRILVHSASSAVLETILQAQRVQVIVGESRPQREGALVAQRLLEAGIEVELVVDAAAPWLVEEVDLVLFGADGIGDFGLVHKIGSYSIALGARWHSKELVVLAHPKKFWPPGFRLPPQSLRPPEEIDSGSYPKRNIYFDITPLELITRILS